MLHIPSTGQRSDSAQSRIYRYLYESKDFCTKQALAKHCKISMPTLYQNLSELMENGLVRYSGEEQSTGGRKAQGLEIIPDARYAVGMSIMESRLRFAAADLRLNELAYHETRFAGISQLTEQTGTIRRELDAFLDSHGLDHERMLGVGITIPGIVTPECDRIVMAPTLHLRDTPLDTLTQDIPYPVYIKNDASSSGYAEWFARGEFQRNMAYLSLENGVGGAVLANYTPYGGDNGRSGEFGHICVEPGGLPCCCGRRGCLEAYCSAQRITEELGITPDEFFVGADRHDPACETLLYDMLRHLAIGINNIHMALDCDVVLGGILSEYLQPYLPSLKRYVLAGNPFETDADFVRLSTLRRHTAPLGAALYFIREFISCV